MKAGRTLAGGSRRISSAASTAVAIMAATVVMIFSAMATLAPRVSWAADTGANPVVATIGDHQITQNELDTAVLQSVPKSKLYSIRKQTLDNMVDTYLIDAAAKKANLAPDAYLARELQSKGGQVAEADARKYYDAHKAGIDAQTGGRPFSEIKAQLIAAMQRHNDLGGREALVAKLRADAHVKVALEEPRVSVVSSGHPWSGGKDAPVTIVEFSDFQCPYCRSAEPVLKQVRAKYGDKVKFVYMDFPLGMHQHAMDAAVAGRCAADQNKFWQLHDAMFSDQTKLDAAGLKASAAKVGLDTKKFNACFDAKTGVAEIKADQAQGERLGVNGTPTFFVNGRELVGMESENGFTEVIDDELSHPGAPQTQANAH
jgi:predicted DsbA family dithiol-disulfide isomerase